MSFKVGRVVHLVENVLDPRVQDFVDIRDWTIS